ncbi:hypothetical protein [Kitasatospora sp. NPDC092286]|uniref:hypothetical protein n=1 Tax=Kitasatospora sp. NPDC092286 TaxID=3364087 RepID=UPI0037F67628
MDQDPQAGQLAVDHDAERIAAALRNSPHIATAAAEPGDTVRFTTTEGIAYRIRLNSTSPLTDAPMTEPIPTEAVAAAILNDPAFVVALPDEDVPVFPRQEPLPDPLPVQGITVQSREGFFYYLALELDPTRATTRREPPAPAADTTHAPDPRVEQLAVAYWNRTRTGGAAWIRLKPEIRAELTEKAGLWLQAAEQAGLVPVATAPSGEHAAVLLDEQGTVWAQVPTSDAGEDLVLPLVYAREEASSRRDLEDQGHRLTHIGWTR